jgi:hypothetical protein
VHNECELGMSAAKGRPSGRHLLRFSIKHAIKNEGPKRHVQTLAANPHQSSTRERKKRQVCKRASVQACKRASVQACKRASVQACKRASVQASRPCCKRRVRLRNDDVPLAVAEMLGVGLKQGVVPAAPHSRTHKPAAPSTRNSQAALDACRASGPKVTFQHCEGSALLSPTRR